ncbi:hypothetical protein Tco_1427263, partial [Tanacetum coccineum]
TYRIPLDLHPRLPDHGFTMDHLPGDAIGIYSEFLRFSSVHIPFSTFLLSVLKYFKDVCIDDGPSSLKKWKDKFFLIDRRAIPDYLTWRHSCSCVSDDFPTDGYDQNDVERLCARLICLCEMREERVPSHTTAPAAEGALIPLPTPYEIAASLPDPHLAKKRRLRKRSSEAGSSAPELGQTEGVDEADLTNFCAEIENSWWKLSAFGPSHGGTLVHASTSGRGLSLRGVVVSGYAG